jgi:hypothetical protein
MKLEPIICTSSAWSSVYAHFVVHLFEGHLGLAEMDRMHALGEHWRAANPGKRVELVLVFPSDAQMSQEERARMARLIKHGEAQRAASATVILAQGLLASFQRSVLTGMMMIVPAPHPAKVFGNVADALRWLSPQTQAVCDQALSVEALSALVDANIAAFRARPTRAA